MQKHISKVKKDLLVFMDYLKTNGHERLFDDKPALRAVKILFHTNKNGIKKIFQDKHQSAHKTIIDLEIEKAIARKETYGCKLIGLRLHHELTILQIDGYKDLAKELAYSAL
jgi:hypothetical protein